MNWDPYASLKWTDRVGGNGGGVGRGELMVDLTENQSNGYINYLVTIWTSFGDRTFC